MHCHIFQRSVFLCYLKIHHSKDVDLKIWVEKAKLFEDIKQCCVFQLPISSWSCLVKIYLTHLCCTFHCICFVLVTCNILLPFGIALFSLFREKKNFLSTLFLTYINLIEFWFTLSFSFNINIQIEKKVQVIDFLQYATTKSVDLA